MNKTAERIRRRWGLQQRSELAGSKSSNLTHTLVGHTRTIDHQIRYDIKAVRARCREIGQGPVVKSFKDVLLNNVLGAKGINFQMKVKRSALYGDANDGENDKTANDIIETAYKTAVNRDNYLVSGDVSKRLADEIKLLALVDEGEIFIRTWKPFPNESLIARQLIDADVCDIEYNVPILPSGGQIRMGIEFDEWGRRVAYYFLKRIPGDYQYGKPPADRHEIVPASEIRHLFLKLKPGQSRGIPLTACAILSVRQLEAFVDAAVVNARIGAARNVYYTKEFPTGWTPDDAAAVMGTDEGAIVDDLAEGEMLELPYGVKAEMLDTRFPEQSIDPFCKTAMRFNAMALGTSYMTLSNDLSEANFSSLRAGLNEEHSTWARWQQWFIEEDCEPDFKEFLENGLATQFIPLPANKKKKFMAANFTGRRWSSVNPLQDSAADKMDMEQLIKSPQEVIRSRGGDPEEVLDEIKQFREMAEERGLTAKDDPSLAAEVLKASIKDQENEKAA